MHFHTCKITVLKKSIDNQLIDDYLDNSNKMTICNIVEENQEFIVTNPYVMPENICASAWADIRPYIITMANGGKFGIMKDNNIAIATCTDPFRPVIFKIECLD